MRGISAACTVGATLNHDDNQHDAAGDYLTCPSCQTQYRPIGGQFHDQGQWCPERWCGWCQEWQPTGSMRAAAQGCVVCGHDFDDSTDPPEAALMPPREPRALAREVLSLLERPGVLEQLVQQPDLREELQRWIDRFRAQWLLRRIASAGNKEPERPAKAQDPGPWTGDGDHER
jgi:hypothetical protein